ncbi:beta-galactoside alpha-2,6-sialyltransferase 2 [Trichonephila clavipes]|nr:beta-galactoside alpha-2,6-sialyltransferase 2 [Trichonephila clavipes]
MTKKMKRVRELRENPSLAKTGNVVDDSLFLGIWTDTHKLAISTSCKMTSARGHGVIVYCLNSGSDDIQTGRHNDSHDVILRFNSAPTEGYQEDVGSKTTIRFLNSQVVSKPEFDFLNSPMYRNVTLIVWDPSKYHGSLEELRTRATVAEWSRYQIVAACLEFESGTTEDPPCRGAMHVKSVVSSKSSWGCGVVVRRGSANSGVVLVT